MIRVKIINGAAVDVEDLQLIGGRLSLGWNFLVGIWNKYLIDSFQVVKLDQYKLNVEEGEEYWGCPFGNGKICLIEQISGNYLIA